MPYLPAAPRRGLTPLALTMLMAFGTAPAVQAQGAQASEQAALPGVTQRLIVKYRANSAAASRPDLFQSMAQAHAAINRQGVQMSFLRRTAGAATVMKLDRWVSAGQAERLAREIMAADADVEYAEPDRMAGVQFVPNDPRYLEQWHYHEAAAGINLPAAWDVSTGSGVVVAVVDTGVRPHADLAGRLLQGSDFISDITVANDGNGRDNDASDPGDGASAGECGVGQPSRGSTWHGTHVAGTLAAATGNGAGVAGVAFNARILPVRVLGKCGGYTSDIADAVIWASGGSVPGVAAPANPARVINMSLAGVGACEATLSNAIAGARSRGTVVVVAAANASSDAAGYFPANCPGVITVAAVSRSGGRASYSNFGAVVDIAAPGGDGTDTDRVLSTHNSGSMTPGADTYALRQGTSMAAPHVAGVVALMLAARPAATPTEIENTLLSTARPFPATCTQCGRGIVDARAAVTSIAQAAGSTLTEVEPNDNRGRAQAVNALPAVLSGFMASPTDNDYTRVRVEPGQTLEAKLTPNSTSNYNLHVFDANGVELARSTRKIGLVDNVQVPNAGTAAVNMFVRVRYASGGTGATAGAYRLELRKIASAP